MPGTVCAQRGPSSLLLIAAQDEYGREIATPPQDRVAAVRPFWESMASQELRVELLSATLPELQERAKEIAVRQRKQAGQGLPASGQ